MSRADQGAFPHIDCLGRQLGLTIREEFAKAAMQGLVAHYGAASFTPSNIAEWAVARADALIAELAKVKP